MNNKPNTKCRICGKEYFCCADSKNIGSWRTMACCPEHYAEYMKRIEESRKPKIENEKKSTKKSVLKKDTKEVDIVEDK